MKWHSSGCLVCGYYHTEAHHVFYGPYRNKSDKFGYLVPLCSKHHRDNKHGVHFNKELDNKLKRQFQKVYEVDHSRESFIKEFGRNYLD